MSTMKGARSGLCRSPYNRAVLVDDHRKDTQGEIAKDDKRDRWYKRCRDSTKYAQQREGIQGLVKYVNLEPSVPRSQS
jgi:hypothetical protein